jgi:hypothetical protein
MDWSSLLTLVFIGLLFFMMMRHGGGCCGGMGSGTSKDHKDAANKDDEIPQKGSK